MWATKDPEMPKYQDIFNSTCKSNTFHEFAYCDPAEALARAEDLGYDIDDLPL